MIKVQLVEPYAEMEDIPTLQGIVSGASDFRSMQALRLKWFNDRGAQVLKG